MLTYKRKLKLTKAQQSRIDSWIGACRTIYNLGLEIRKEAWKNKQQNVHKYELMKQLTAIRDIAWVKDVPRGCMDDSIQRLDKSYQSFFKGAGFPKWASKKNYKSITMRQSLSIKGNTVSVPKMGMVKMVKDSEVLGNIKIITVKKEVTGYYVCIVTDAVKNIKCDDENQVIALDMGVKSFFVDSNGTFVSNPQHFKKYERKLRIENRSLARKKRGSASWEKQAHKLSLLHNKISNVRKDFLHKQSTNISKRNNVVFMENLNVSGMSKNHKLSKHILDCGWANFRVMLSYKTRVISVNPAYTSQTCSECGKVDSNSRISQSHFKCTSCGYQENADLNAAKNIKRKGIAEDRQREAIACA